MTITEATLKALKEFGLTEYEVSAYVALIDYGIQSASEISNKSRVPYSRMYDVLGRLEDKGFIQIYRGRPTRYAAKSPTEVVRIIRLTTEERIEKFSQVVIDELQPRFEQETQIETRDVILIHGRAGILAKALEMFDCAREEIIISLPTLDMSQMEQEFEMGDMSELVDKLFELKVRRVRILTSEVPDNLLALVPRAFEVRTRDKVFGAGLVVDRTHVLIMLAASNSSFLGIYSSHFVFAEIASSYFESLWMSSE